MTPPPVPSAEQVVAAKQYGVDRAVYRLDMMSHQWLIDHHVQYVLPWRIEDESSLASLLAARESSLRAEVAGLRSVLNETRLDLCAAANLAHARDGSTKEESELRRAETRCANAINDTSASAEAFVARVRREAFEEAAKVADLTFAEFQRVNRERCEGPAFGHRVDDWTPNDWATALAGEVGELCNFLKKQRRGEAVPTKALADELGDVMAYAFLLADRLGIDMEHATTSKFNEVSARRGSDIKLPAAAIEERARGTGGRE